jgi:hypothetical protein
MTKPSQWSHILNRQEIDAYHSLTASIDPSFAAKDRAFYESRTDAQLDTLAAQAWNSNQPTPYQLARSYRAAL